MGRDNRLHEGVRLHHPQINLERAQILQHRTRPHPSPEEIIQRPVTLTDEESDMFEMKKGTKQIDPLFSLLFNTVLQKVLEKYIPR